MNVDWLLPYTRPKHFKADDIMMERGEYATAAFYIVSGEVEIVELKETFGKGTLLGEIGLFTPDGRRIMTVRCKTDVQTAIISAIWRPMVRTGLRLVIGRMRSGSRTRNPRWQARDNMDLMTKERDQ